MTLAEALDWLQPPPGRNRLWSDETIGIVCDAARRWQAARGLILAEIERLDRGLKTAAPAVEPDGWRQTAQNAVANMVAAVERADRAEAELVLARQELASSDPDYTPLLDKYVSDIQAYADRATRAELELERLRADHKIDRDAIEEKALDDIKEMWAREDALTTENARPSKLNAGLCHDYNTLLVAESKACDRADRADSTAARLAEAIRKVRDGYASQAKFADADPAAYFRDFIRRIDNALAAYDKGGGE